MYGESLRDRPGPQRAGGMGVITRRRFHLSLEDVGRIDDADVMVRLRIVLKRLLRSWAFRCVEVRELPPGPEPGRGEPAESH